MADSIQEVLQSVLSGEELSAKGPFPTDDDQGGHRPCPFPGLPGRVEEGNAFSPAKGDIGRDEHFGLEVLQPASECCLRETREDDGMDGSKTGACQHGDDLVRCRGKEDRHPVALAHPLGSEGLGKTDRFFEELGVGQGLFLPSVSAPDQRHLGSVSLRHMPVQGIEGNIALCPHEPSSFKGLGIPAEEGVMWADEGQKPGPFLPEGEGIGNSPGVESFIIGNPAFVGDFGRGNKKAGRGLGGMVSHGGSAVRDGIGRWKSPGRNKWGRRSPSVSGL